MQLVANEIKKLQKQDKIIIIISHDYEFLMQCCTDVVLLDKTLKSIDINDQDKILQIMQR